MPLSIYYLSGPARPTEPQEVVIDAPIKHIGLPIIDISALRAAARARLFRQHSNSCRCGGRCDARLLRAWRLWAFAAFGPLRLLGLCGLLTPQSREPRVGRRPQTPSGVFASLGRSTMAPSATSTASPIAVPTPHGWMGGGPDPAVCEALMPLACLHLGPVLVCLGSAVLEFKEGWAAPTGLLRIRTDKYGTYIVSRDHFR